MKITTTYEVTLKLSKSPQALLDASGCRQYTNRDVVDTMPEATEATVSLEFFTVGRYITETKLEQEYEKRGLIPANPRHLIQFNTDHPNFSRDHLNAIHWKDADDKWCFAAFNQWGDDRRVDVCRDEDDWGDGWWFAGVRKSVLKTSDTLSFSNSLPSDHTSWNADALLNKKTNTVKIIYFDDEQVETIWRKVMSHEKDYEIIKVKITRV